MAEMEYFQRNQVRITSARAIFGNKTFALAAITSVEGSRIRPERSVPYFVVLAGVLACAVAARLFMDSTPDGVLALAIGLPVIAVGIVWTWSIGPTYAVILCTSAGERRVFASANQREIGAIVAAVNQAVVDRG